MDKELLGASDIDTVLTASNKLKSGQIIVATLKTGVIHSHTGDEKTFKSLIQDQEMASGEVIDFPKTVPLRGEGIKGEAIVDAFKKARSKTKGKKSFSIKRTFFNEIDKAMAKVNYYILNSRRTADIFFPDEFGRVYVEVENKRCYLNKEKTYFIDEDSHFGRIIIYPDNIVRLKYIKDEDAVSDINFINFSYLFISPQTAAKGTALINAEQERISAEFFKDSYSPMESLFTDFQERSTSDSTDRSKIIDFESYRQSIEEGPKR